MAFDECAPPYDYDYNQQRPGPHARLGGALPGRQNAPRPGSVRHRAGRRLSRICARQSAEFIASLGFPGYAIGGLSVGETKDEMHAMLEVVDAVLPQDQPALPDGRRHAGRPGRAAWLRGVDIFDCVLPTRLARHNAAMTRSGRLNLRQRPPSPTTRAHR